MLKCNNVIPSSSLRLIMLVESCCFDYISLLFISLHLVHNFLIVAESFFLAISQLHWYQISTKLSDKNSQNRRTARIIKNVVSNFGNSFVRLSRQAMQPIVSSILNFNATFNLTQI